jgi:membrane associated rhomboid family serine protease
MSKFALPIEMPLWLLPIVAIVPLILIELIPGIDLPIGNMAHLGGFLFGAAYGLYLRIKYKKKTALIAEYFSA